MLSRLINELLPAASLSTSLSSALKKLCTSSVSSHRYDLERVYDEMLAPCLEQGASLLTKEDDLRHVKTLKVRFHDHPALDLCDYFSSLGYVLSLQDYGKQNSLQRLHLLSLYAKLCKLSSSLVNSRAPTTVQLLWINDTTTIPRRHSDSGDGNFNKRPFSSSVGRDRRLALGSSLAWLKIRSNFQAARKLRSGMLKTLWHHALENPTPMQRIFPNKEGELLGADWGDCAEAISLAAFCEKIKYGVEFGTMALNVPRMNLQNCVSGISPCDEVLASSDLRHISWIIRNAEAFRPMCKNCEHLGAKIPANIVDYAHSYSWDMDDKKTPRPQDCSNNHLGTVTEISYGSVLSSKALGPVGLSLQPSDELS